MRSLLMRTVSLLPMSMWKLSIETRCLSLGHWAASGLHEIGVWSLR